VEALGSNLGRCTVPREVTVVLRSSSTSSHYVTAVSARVVTLLLSIVPYHSGRCMHQAANSFVNFARYKTRQTASLFSVLNPLNPVR
jgi:hypothetical protein